jgi:hypothetical protein
MTDPLLRPSDPLRLLHDANGQLEAIQALRRSMLGWSLNAPLLGTSGGGYGALGARDPSAKTRDRMIEYVGEATDD